MQLTDSLIYLIIIHSFIEDCFFNAVGVVNPNKIADNQMTASTYYSPCCQPSQGRLNNKNKGTDGWCAATSKRVDEWLQVDFGKTYVVCAVATQGDVNGNDRVTDFKLSYSTDGLFWNWYTDRNGTEEVSFNFMYKVKFGNHYDV